jgi:Predicted acetyltransferases and hydrolases with the alpha/beta hydrolase fold
MQPVVLVHGFLDTWYMPWWRRMKKSLKSVGPVPEKIYGVNKGNIPGTTVGSPDNYAEVVERKVEEVYDRHDERVNLVGHSMGGLDSRWYVEQMDGEEYVDTVVTLATPHHGTLTSRYAALTPGGKKLAMSSDVIRTLKQDGLSEDVEYVSLWSPGDSAVKLRGAQSSGGVQGERNQHTVGELQPRGDALEEGRRREVRALPGKLILRAHWLDGPDSQ